MYREEKHVGRPLKYQTAEELQEAINKYFSDCKTEKRPLTVSGLACAIDLSRVALINYEDREKFSDIVNKAKKHIEAYAEESLWQKQNPAGVIFSLKNNWGWKDKQEIQTNITTDSAAAIQAARERVKNGNNSGNK